MKWRRKIQSAIAILLASLVGAMLVMWVTSYWQTFSLGRETSWSEQGTEMRRFAGLVLHRGMLGCGVSTGAQTLGKAKIAGEDWSVPAFRFRATAPFHSPVHPA